MQLVVSYWNSYDPMYQIFFFHFKQFLCLVSADPFNGELGILVTWNSFPVLHVFLVSPFLGSLTNISLAQSISRLKTYEPFLCWIVCFYVTIDSSVSRQPRKFSLTAGPVSLRKHEISKPVSILPHLLREPRNLGSYKWVMEP